MPSDPGVKAVLFLVASANEATILQLLGAAGNATTGRRLQWSLGTADAGRPHATASRLLLQTATATANTTGTSTNSTNSTSYGTSTSNSTSATSVPAVPLMDWAYMSDYAVEDLPVLAMLDVPPLPPNYTLDSGLGPDQGNLIETKLANSSVVTSFKGKGWLQLQWCCMC